MSKLLIISSCSECHHFNNEYYSYEESCDELDRVIVDYETSIPDDCPLPTINVVEGDVS